MDNFGGRPQRRCLLNLSYASVGSPTENARKIPLPGLRRIRQVLPFRILNSLHRRGPYIGPGRARSNLPKLLCAARRCIFCPYSFCPFRPYNHGPFCVILGCE
jgi:hypothetical protein